MKPTLLMIVLLPITAACQSNSNSFKQIGQIPAPPGYTRMMLPAGSFGEWLRKLPLKDDNRVFLYNGKLKANQSAQYAVLDISVGKKDLQQCADAIMRLRAEYFYQRKEYASIDFWDNNKTHYRLKANADRNEFNNYLEKVFTYCGTLSLQQQLRSSIDVGGLKPGDVFIKGGSPGHAVIIVDVLVNKEGKKLFMLAQSYMPAQDIHLLVNPDETGSPWYEIPVRELRTPEWTFEAKHLRTW
jgi:hypothetical protein